MVGTLCQVNEEDDQVFVICQGTCVGDQMKPEELKKIAVNTESPSRIKLKNDFTKVLIP
jgi:hypothetical protein